MPYSRITFTDLLRGFESIGVPSDESDAKLFLRRYDADVDLKLGFWEFSNSLMPNDPYLRDEIERREGSHGPKELT